MFHFGIALARPSPMSIAKFIVLLFAGWLADIGRSTAGNYIGILYLP